MEQHEFLQRILPPLTPINSTGAIPVYYAFSLVGDRPSQAPCSSLSDVVDYCNAMSSSGADAYMALASFADPTLGRKQVNAFEMKGLWADIDAGKPTSAYANTTEALQGLGQFVATTGLNPSILVSSGMGLHAYWTFTQTIKADVWRQLADLFYRLCLQTQFHVDPTRARDEASVLRLPGTIHQKTGRTVAILGEGQDWSARTFLDKMAGAIDPNFVPPVAAYKPKYLGASQQYTEAERAMGMGPQPATAKAHSIVMNCPQMLTMGMYREPQWFMGMSVLKRCVDGYEWAHQLSAMDPRYEIGATDRKYQLAAEDSPALCVSFEAENPDLCRKCQFYGQVKTPVQLHRLPQPAPLPPIVKAPPSTPIADTDSHVALLLGHTPSLKIPEKWDYPYVTINSLDFKVDYRGIVWIRQEKDSNGGWTTDEKVICTSQLYFKHSIYELVDQRPRRSHVFEAVHPNGKREELRFNLEEDMGVQNIMLWFNQGNMYANGAYSGKVFMEFMNAYLLSVVHNATELPIFDAFGWNNFVDPVSKQEKQGFVVGSGVITDTGMHHIKHGKKTAPHADKAFAHKGSLETWKHIPRMYSTLKQEIGQLAICLSFAAPLMKFGSGDARNAVLSIWSASSGLGKSQVLRAAASIWGNPMELFFTRQESVVARTHRLGIWNNLPAFMDEITDMPDEDMYNLAYTLAGGMEKNKLKSSGDAFVKTGEWSTTTLTTANKSFKEAISKRAGDSEATLLRVMEYECEFPSYEHMPEVQKYIEACMKICRANYGLAGPEFMYQLLQRPERLMTLTNQVEYWSTKNGFRTKERFMSFALALAITAGRWAHEFGLIEYDMDALERWTLQEFVPHNRKYTREWSPDHVNNLNTYLSDRQQNTLIVTQEDRDPVTERDPGKAAWMPDPYIIYKPVRDVLLRYVRKENCLYFSKSDFNAWCKKRNVSPLVLIRQLEASGITFQKVNVTLSKHISTMATGRFWCYKLDDAAVKAIGYSVDIPSTPATVLQTVKNLSLEDLNGPV